MASTICADRKPRGNQYFKGDHLFHTKVEIFVSGGTNISGIQILRHTIQGVKICLHPGSINAQIDCVQGGGGGGGGYTANLLSKEGIKICFSAGGAHLFNGIAQYTCSITFNDLIQRGV